MSDLERLVAAAERHGSESDPDHEVGDLQEILGATYDLLDAKQRAVLMQNDLVRDLLKDWGDSSGLSESYALNLRDETGGDLPAVVRFENDMVLIHLAGHGNGAVEDDYPSAPVVALELYENKPRLLVFADYSNEAPTQTIDLSGSKKPEKERTEGAHGS